MFYDEQERRDQIEIQMCENDSAVGTFAMSDDSSSSWFREGHRC